MSTKPGAGHINAFAFRMNAPEQGSFSTKKFKAKILSNEQSSFSQLARVAMNDEHGVVGILSRMSLYRSVALHCMGITNPVSGSAVILKQETGILGIGQRLVFPLYDDLDFMKKINSGGAGYSLRRNVGEIQRFLGLESHDDALDFGFDCFELLLTMARLLGKELGLESRLLTLTDDDIIEVSGLSPS